MHMLSNDPPHDSQGEILFVSTDHLYIAVKKLKGLYSYLYQIHC